MINCPWCNTDFPPLVRGGNVKRFCSVDCRGKWHKAASELACQLEAAGAINLRKWVNALPDTRNTLKSNVTTG